MKDISCILSTNYELKAKSFSFKKIFSYKKKTIRNWKFAILNSKLLYFSFYYDSSEFYEKVTYLTQFVVTDDYSLVNLKTIKTPNVAEWTYFAKSESAIAIHYSIEYPKSIILIFNHQLEKLKVFRFQEEKENEESKLIGIDHQFMYLSELGHFQYRVYDTVTFEKIFVVNNINPLCSGSFDKWNSIKQLEKVKSNIILLDFFGLRILDTESSNITYQFDIKEVIFFKVKLKEIFLFKYCSNVNRIEIMCVNFNCKLLGKRELFLKDFNYLKNNENIYECANFDFEEKFYILNIFKENLYILE